VIYYAYVIDGPHKGTLVEHPAAARYLEMIVRNDVGSLWSVQTGGHPDDCPLPAFHTQLYEKTGRMFSWKGVEVGLYAMPDDFRGRQRSGAVGVSDLALRALKALVKEHEA